MADVIAMVSNPNFTKTRSVEELTEGLKWTLGCQFRCCGSKGIAAIKSLKYLLSSHAADREIGLLLSFFRRPQIGSRDKENLGSFRNNRRCPDGMLNKRSSDIPIPFLFLKRKKSDVAFTRETNLEYFPESALSDEAHFWLNGYGNKQNCLIWSEANPQVYVETPLHPEKLTVWCALWAGGIILQKR
ncbi:hypothetical protein TNCV_163671 [Trichonephila clavipes]|nr:hypothetical protein TNCV_163671 [Trichonephila clavipes]